jgi:hypothetical protein
MGDSGGCALSRQTRTKRASSSSSGSVDGAGAELCPVGGGGRPVIVVCRSLRKDGDGDGDSAVLMNCPGRISCEPNTASGGENYLSSLKEALMPSITQGRWSCQSAAAARDRKASFSCLWNGLINPFDCGWYAVVGGCWMLSRLHRPAHRADVNLAPLSDVMVAGTPNRDTQRKGPWHGRRR